MYHEIIVYDDNGTYYAIGDDRWKYRGSGETPADAIREIADCFDAEWEPPTDSDGGAR